MYTPETDPARTTRASATVYTRAVARARTGNSTGADWMGDERKTDEHSTAAASINSIIWIAAHGAVNLHSLSLSSPTW